MRVRVCECECVCMYVCRWVGKGPTHCALCLTGPLRGDKYGPKDEPICCGCNPCVRVALALDAGATPWDQFVQKKKKKSWDKCVDEAQKRFHAYSYFANLWLDAPPSARPFHCPLHDEQDPLGQRYLPLCIVSQVRLLYAD
jgi:hypothetical protein